MRSWRWWLSLSALPLWGTLAFLLWAAANALANRALLRELDRVRAAGQPLVPTQCAVPSIPDEDNAAFLWLRGMAILHPSDDAWSRQDFLKDWNRESDLGPRAELWVSANAPALEDLKKAAARPACRFPIDYSKGATADAPGWLSSHRCAQLLGCAARLAHERGDAEEADVLFSILLRLGVAMGEEPMLMTSMAGQSVFKTAFDLLQAAFDAGFRPGPATRRRIHDLRPGLFQDALARSLRLERSMLLSAFLSPALPDPERRLPLEHRIVGFAPFRPYLKWDLARFCRLFQDALRNAEAPSATGAWARPSSDDIERRGGWLAASLVPHFPTLAALAIEGDVQLDLLQAALEGTTPLDRFTGRPMGRSIQDGILTIRSAGRDGILGSADDLSADVPIRLER